MCIIGPKSEARIHGPRVSSGLYIQEVIYIGWVQLSSLVRPKRHRTACVIGPKGEARTFEPCAPSGPNIQEVILPLVMVILGFLTIPSLGSKGTELHAPCIGVSHTIGGVNWDSTYYFGVICPIK